MNMFLFNIGIDDVSIRKGACRKHPGDCSFESDGLCSWENDEDFADFDWVMHQPSSSIFENGPLIDQ